jgi:hypothetical protein
LDEEIGLPALKISSTKSQSSEGAGLVLEGSNYGGAEGA